MSAAAAPVRTVIEVGGDGHESDAENGVASSDTGAMSGQYRQWFFTINSPTDAQRNPDTLWPLLVNIFGEIVGGVYQHERAGHDHLQGCFTTKQKYRPTTMKNKFRAKALRGWVRPCVDYEKSLKYCSKDETRVAGPYWYGDMAHGDISRWKGQGNRTDLKEVAVDIDNGKTLAQVAAAHPSSFIKYHSGIRDYFSVTQSQTPRDFMTELFIYWGAPGTGKSRRAWFEASQLGSVYELPVAKDANVIWWPGYRGQDSVILDDFYGWFPFHQILKMIDRYEWKVRTKGDDFAQFKSRRVFITANSNWPTWYSKEFMREGHWKGAFERRITSCVEFKEGDNWTPSHGMDAVAQPPPRLSPAASPMERHDYYDELYRAGAQPQEIEEFEL